MKLITTKGNLYNIIGIGKDKLIVQEVGVYFVPLYVYRIEGSNNFTNGFIKFDNVIITDNLNVTQNLTN